MILRLLGPLVVLAVSSVSQILEEFSPEYYETGRLNSLLQERYPFSNVKAIREQSRVYTYRVPAYAAREYGLPGEGGYLPPYKVLTIKAEAEVGPSQTEPASSNSEVTEEALTEAAPTTTTTPKPTTTRPLKPKPPVPKPPPPPPPPLPPPHPSTNSISASPPKPGKHHERIPPKPHSSTHKTNHKKPPKPPNKKMGHHYFKEVDGLLGDSPIERVYISEDESELLKPVNREYITEEDPLMLNDYNVEIVNHAVVLNDPDSHRSVYYEYSIPVLTTSV